MNAVKLVQEEAPDYYNQGLLLNRPFVHLQLLSEIIHFTEIISLSCKVL